MPTSSIADYYDNNTRRFLSRGQNAGSHNIHQPLWPSTVHNLQEAVNYSNSLVLRELQSIRGASPQAPLQVLDLGCGVGASLLYLSEACASPTAFLGITISKLQVEIAQAEAAKRGSRTCTFVCGDFEDLSAVPPTHLAYAIEAFVHARNAACFFKEVARSLLPGGKLIIIDDILTERALSGLTTREEAWLADFRSGWMASSLLSEASIATLAVEAGLHVQESENLTPYMRIGRPRDKLIGVARRIAGRYMRRSLYLRALCGGYAKQQCLKTGLVEYRRLVLVRSPLQAKAQGPEHSPKE